MAYQAKRAKKFDEDFELVDDEGNVVKTLHVHLNADDVVKKLTKKYADLTRVMAETTELKHKGKNTEDVENAIETLGHAVVSLLEAVFGDKDAAEIITFYEGNYIEMCREVLPFVTQVIIPRCIEIKNENQKNILSSYNRKQRRTLFKR